MATTKKGRAWVPATVTTLLTILLLGGCAMLRDILEDRDVEALRDPTSLVGAFVYHPLAPLGGLGIVGDRDMSDSLAQFGGGLVPVVIVVFLFTWLSARAARAGSSFPVLLGAWLGAVIGVGLGALASYQVFLWQNDVGDDLFPVHQQRVEQLEVGAYWGAAAGLVIGLVALLTWLMVRPSGVEPAEEAPQPGPPDLSSYPPPPKHASPASGVSDETVRAPEPPPPNL